MNSSSAIQSQYFEALFRNSPIAIVTLDSDHKVVSLNSSFEKLFGFSQEELIGKTIDDFISNPTTRQEAKSYTEAVQKGGTISEQAQRVRKGGGLVDVAIRGVPVIVEGKQVGALGMYIDITEQLATQRKLAQSQLRFRSLFDYSPIALWEEDWSYAKKEIERLRQEGVKDLSAYFHENPSQTTKFAKKVRAIDFNRAAVQLFSAKSGRGLVEKFHETFTDDSFRFFIGALCAFFLGESKWMAEAEMLTLNGQARKFSMLASIPPLTSNTWATIYLSALDITETKLLQDELAEALRKMEVLALTDGLTGVLNRGATTDNLATEIERATREGTSLAIALVDIDKFKQINDTYGHNSGDQALKFVANELNVNTRKYDRVGRWGGDEFLVILPKADSETARKIATRICNSISSQKIHTDDSQDIGLTMSIGICVLDHVSNPPTVEEMISKADEALYSAKSQGGNQTVVYQSNRP